MTVLPQPGNLLIYGRFLDQQVNSECSDRYSSRPPARTRHRKPDHCHDQPEPRGDRLTPTRWRLTPSPWSAQAVTV